ncbi:hypothetical protein [Rhodococcus opacus]|uniref:hypothetical protein n=1 Tax=Rhodococcus opacus TaxID=37919 RepID=UPI001C4565D6|nr:hypothetical protein [Rhodococcus opacus]MBV6761454.1 hypothetical protein [Rhodococcus opacus]
MTDPTPTPPPPHRGAGGGPEHRTPRWVKVVGVVVGLLLVLLLAVMLFGSGNHGPGRHMSAPAAVVHPARDFDSGRTLPDSPTGPIAL